MKYHVLPLQRLGANYYAADIVATFTNERDAWKDADARDTMNNFFTVRDNHGVIGAQ